MIAIILSPLYIIAALYIARWLIKWMGACSKHFKKTWIRIIVLTIYAFFASTLVIEFFLPDGKFHRFMKHIANYWMGVLVYVFLTVVVVDGIRLILHRIKKINQEKLRSNKCLAIVGAVCIIFIGSVSTLGALNARIIRTTPYEITVEKDAGNLDSLNVVLVADLHMGYNIGCKQIERMTEKINKQNADIVLIAGDIFNNDYDSLEDPDRLIKSFQNIKSKYGIYACYGNHDVQEKILAGFTFNQKEKKQSDVRMDTFLEKAGINLLIDDYVLIDNSFYIYGRPDYERPGRNIEKRKPPEEIMTGIDKSKPVIVIDHEPKELQELADVGVDVDLCGHTHDGQLFPGNIVTALTWENSCGYLKKDNMHNIVTSGVGLFGPNMRVGTIAEICQITVNFSK